MVSYTMFFIKIKYQKINWKCFTKNRKQKLVFREISIQRKKYKIFYMKQLRKVCQKKWRFNLLGSSSGKGTQKIVGWTSRSPPAGHAHPHLSTPRGLKPLVCTPWRFVPLDLQEPCPQALPAHSPWVKAHSPARWSFVPLVLHFHTSPPALWKCPMLVALCMSRP